MWPNLLDCFESDCSIKSKLSYFNTSINVLSLSLEIESEISFVKNKIREYVGDPSKRAEGLLLLYAVVHCSSTVYIDNWGLIVLGTLQCHDSVIPRKLPLQVLNKVLVNFGGESAYSDVFSKVIPDILKILLKPEDDKNYKLSCQSLAFCMKHASEIVGPHVAEIEKLLVKELDNPYGEITEAIGECFAVLPLCMKYFLKTNVNLKEMWYNIYMKILNTMKFILNDFLKLSGDEETFDMSGLAVFDIPSSKLNNIVPLPQIDIFKSLCHCLAKMISSQDCRKSLSVSELMITLRKTFQIVKIVKDQCRNSQKKSKETKMGFIKLGFAQMMNGVFVVLEALILNFTIIDQSRNFVATMNLAFDAIKNTSFSQLSVSQVRSSTWKLINVWLKRYGSKGSYPFVTDKDILTEILADIDIVGKESVNLRQLESNNRQDHNQKENNVLSCIHALKVLKSLIETNDGYMEKQFLDKICSTLVQNSKHVVCQKSPAKPFPYNDETCRKMLLDVLLTCAIHSDPLQSKCIMQAQNIFCKASRDSSMKVARVCLRFRKLSRYYLNPKKPPPDALHYSQPSLHNSVKSSTSEDIRAEWGEKIEWSNANGSYNDEENMVEQAEEGSERLESENDLIPMEQIEETDSHMNHDYRISKSSQSMGEEDSIDDSDVEPTYVSNDSNSHRIGMNNCMNSFVMQSCGEQYANETRTERCFSEETVPNVTNTVENNTGEHVSAFEEVNCNAQKISQLPVGNGDVIESEEDSEIDEGDEEGNEEASDNAADETSDGKHSPEFDEERPNKRQKCNEEEDDVDEEIEDEDAPANNQSSDEEMTDVNNVPVLEQNTESNSENLIDEESRDGNEDIGCGSPSLREMCNDFVLAEPPATQS